MKYDTLLIETPAEGVRLIRLNRPRQYNALNSTLLIELGKALETFDADDAIGSVIITGSGKHFAAGADIAEMAGISGQEMLEMVELRPVGETISTFSKPVFVQFQAWRWAVVLKVSSTVRYFTRRNRGKVCSSRSQQGLYPVPVAHNVWPGLLVNHWPWKW